MEKQVHVGAYKSPKHHRVWIALSWLYFFFFLGRCLCTFFSERRFVAFFFRTPFLGFIDIGCLWGRAFGRDSYYTAVYLVHLCGAQLEYTLQFDCLKIITTSHRKTTNGRLSCLMVLTPNHLNAVYTEHKKSAQSMIFCTDGR